jgi:hypothetical protein
LISDIDIWRNANELIEQLGDTADIAAAMRLDVSALFRGELRHRPFAVKGSTSLGSMIVAMIYCRSINNESRFREWRGGLEPGFP